MKLRIVILLLAVCRLAEAPRAPRAPLIIELNPVEYAMAILNSYQLAKPLEQVPIGIEIVKASLVYQVDAGEAVRRGWLESRLTNTISFNVSEGSYNVGPLQVNTKWSPGIQHQSVRQQIWTGVKILAKYHNLCHQDWRCTHKAYASGVYR